MTAITIDNHGALIRATDYWDSAVALAGKIIVSPNAGVIRCLIPPDLMPTLNELRGAEYAICSRGRWQGREAIEILWEDHTDAPHVWHLTAESCLMLPGDPSPEEWSIACWINKKGRPHRALERACHWRRVDTLPCLQPLRSS